jgi:serine/threonine-protein kinase HipA
MFNKENLCYVYTQLPGSFEWVPCASLKVKELGAGAFQGTFTYGKRYLARQNLVELDPYHLKLTDKPMQFTKLKGIPGALRDASPDAWGRRIIQAAWLVSTTSYRTAQALV